MHLSVPCLQVGRTAWVLAGRRAQEAPLQGAAVALVVEVTHFGEKAAATMEAIEARGSATTVAARASGVVAGGAGGAVGGEDGKGGGAREAARQGGAGSHSKAVRAGVKAKSGAGSAKGGAVGAAEGGGLGRGSDAGTAAAGSGTGAADGAGGGKGEGEAGVSEGVVQAVSAALSLAQALLSCHRAAESQARQFIHHHTHHTSDPVSSMHGSASRLASDFAALGVVERAPGGGSFRLTSPCLRMAMPEAVASQLSRRLLLGPSPLPLLTPGGAPWQLLSPLLCLSMDCWAGAREPAGKGGAGTGAGAAGGDRGRSGAQPRVEGCVEACVASPSVGVLAGRPLHAGTSGDGAEAGPGERHREGQGGDEGPGGEGSVRAAVLDKQEAARAAAWESDADLAAQLLAVLLQAGGVPLRAPLLLRPGPAVAGARRWLLRLQRPVALQLLCELLQCVWRALQQQHYLGESVEAAMCERAEAFSTTLALNPRAQDPRSVAQRSWWGYLEAGMRPEVSTQCACHVWYMGMLCGTGQGGGHTGGLASVFRSA